MDQNCFGFHCSKFFNSAFRLVKYCFSFDLSSLLYCLLHWTNAYLICGLNESLLKRILSLFSSFLNSKQVLSNHFFLGFFFLLMVLVCLVGITHSVAEVIILLRCSVSRSTPAWLLLYTWLQNLLRCDWQFSDLNTPSINIL